MCFFTRPRRSLTIPQEAPPQIAQQADPVAEPLTPADIDEMLDQLTALLESDVVLTPAELATASRAVHHIRESLRALLGDQHALTQALTQALARSQAPG